MAKERKEQQCAYSLGRQRAENKQERWKGIKWDPFDVNLIFYSLSVWYLWASWIAYYFVLSLKKSAVFASLLTLNFGVKFDFIAADSAADFDDLRLGGIGFGPQVASIEIQCWPGRHTEDFSHSTQRWSYSFSYSVGECHAWSVIFWDVLVSSFMYPISRDPVSR